MSNGDTEQTIPNVEDKWFRVYPDPDVDITFNPCRLQLKEVLPNGNLVVYSVWKEEENGRWWMRATKEGKTLRGYVPSVNGFNIAKEMDNVLTKPMSCLEAD